jgi:hypothetical protein
MDWQLKVWLQRGLSTLPPWAGDPVYHCLQTLNGLAPEVSENAAFLRRVEQFLASAGTPGLKGKRVVELGSGWYPVLPFLLLEAGARDVITVDLNRHYSVRRIREAAAAVLPHTAHGPAREALRGSAASGRLPEAVRYYPRTGIQSLAPEVLKGTDLALSRFVLEHVRPEDLEEIQSASHRWMNPDGLWIHAVSSSDHRAHSDSSLHLVDFLRYSEEEWRKLGGNRYAYHNRLRLPQYRQLFERVGWRVVLEESNSPADAMAALPDVPVHPDFRHFRPEDLVAGSLWFVLGRTFPHTH